MSTAEPRDSMKNTTHRTEASNRSRATVAEPTDRSLTVWGWVYILLALLVFGVATFVGSTSWTPADIWASFMSDDQTDFNQWRGIRVKHVLFAGTVGSLLSLSGLVFQAVLRNPLAEPYILGVSGGASLATIAVPWLGVAVVGGNAIAVVAFSGAIGSVVLLFGLARLGHFRDTTTLILCGVILNAVFLAAILVFLSLAPEFEAKATMRLLIGDFMAVGLVPNQTVVRNVVTVVLGGVVFLAMARNLDLLSLSDEEAADLGLRPNRFRWSALILASVLTGVAVAGVGPVGFVGLIVPHVVKLLHGPSHSRAIPLVLAGGAAFMMAADAAARIFNPVPVGAITALCGGPFFLFLLVRGRREVAT